MINKKKVDKLYQMILNEDKQLCGYQWEDLNPNENDTPKTIIDEFIRIFLDSAFGKYDENVEDYVPVANINERKEALIMFFEKVIDDLKNSKYDTLSLTCKESKKATNKEKVEKLYQMVMNEDDCIKGKQWDELIVSENDTPKSIIDQVIYLFLDTSFEEYDEDFDEYNSLVNIPEQREVLIIFFEKIVKDLKEGEYD